MRLLERIGFAAAVLAYGIPEPAAPAPLAPAHIPAENPLLAEEGSAARREAALRMMDGDCFGFVLFTVHRHPEQSMAQILMAQHVDDSWWPSIALTLERVASSVPRA